jgi:hypothetical protein
LIIFTSINYPPLKLGNYNFPLWSYKLGWGLTALILSGIVFYAIYALIFFVILKRNVKKQTTKLMKLYIRVFLFSHVKF